MALKEELRAAAASCLHIAQNTSDQTARARLVMLAQNCIELAIGSGSPSDHVFSMLLDEFNDAQMLKRYGQRSEWGIGPGIKSPPNGTNR
jgi:hypothetical protein